MGPVGAFTNTQAMKCPNSFILICRTTECHSGVQDLTGSAANLLSGVQKQTTLISKVLSALADRYLKS